MNINNVNNINNVPNVNDGLKPIAVRKFLDLNVKVTSKKGLNGRRIVVVNPKTRDIKYGDLAKEPGGYQLVSKRMLLDAIKNDNPDLYTDDFLREAGLYGEEVGDDLQGKELDEFLEGGLTDDYLEKALGKTLLERSIYCLEGREFDSFSGVGKHKFTREEIDTLKAEESKEIKTVERSLIVSDKDEKISDRNKSLETAANILEGRLEARRIHRIHRLAQKIGMMVRGSESDSETAYLFKFDENHDLVLDDKWSTYVEDYFQTNFQTKSETEYEVFGGFIATWSGGGKHPLQMFCDLYNKSQKRGSDEFLGETVCAGVEEFFRIVHEDVVERSGLVDDFKDWIKDNFGEGYSENETDCGFQVLNEAFKTFGDGQKTLKEVEQDLILGKLTDNPFKNLNKDVEIEDLKKKVDLARKWFGKNCVFELERTEVKNDENNKRELKVSFKFSNFDAWSAALPKLEFVEKSLKGQPEVACEIFIGLVQDQMEDLLKKLCASSTTLESLDAAVESALQPCLEEAARRATVLKEFEGQIGSELQELSRIEKAFAVDKINLTLSDDSTRHTLAEIRNLIREGKFTQDEVKKEITSAQLKFVKDYAKKYAKWFFPYKIFDFDKEEGGQLRLSESWSPQLILAVAIKGGGFELYDLKKEGDKEEYDVFKYIVKNDEVKFAKLFEENRESLEMLCTAAEKWIENVKTTAKERAGELKKFKAWFNNTFDVEYDSDTKEFSTLKGFPSLVKSSKKNSENSLKPIEEAICAGEHWDNILRRTIDPVVLDNMISVTKEVVWLGEEGVFDFNANSQTLTLRTKWLDALIKIAQDKNPSFKEKTAQLIFRKAAETGALKSELAELLKKEKGGWSKIVKAAADKLEKFTATVTELQKEWFDSGFFQVGDDSSFALAEGWKTSSVVTKKFSEIKDDDARATFKRLLDSSLEEEIKKLFGGKNTSAQDPQRLCKQAGEILEKAQGTAQKRAAQLQTFRTWVKDEFGIGKYGSMDDLRYVALNACLSAWLSPSSDKLAWKSLNDVENAIRDGKFFQAYQGLFKLRNVLQPKTEELNLEVFKSRLALNAVERQSAKRQFDDYQEWFGPDGVFKIEDGKVQVVGNWSNASVVMELAKGKDSETRKIFESMLSEIERDIKGLCSENADSSALAKNLTWIKTLCGGAKNVLNQALNEAGDRVTRLQNFSDALKKEFGIWPESAKDAGYRYLSTALVFGLPSTVSRVNLKSIEDDIRSGKLKDVPAVSKLVDVDTVKATVVQKRWLADQDEKCVFDKSFDMPSLSPDEWFERLVEMTEQSQDLKMEDDELKQFKNLRSGMGIEFSELCDTFKSRALNKAKNWEASFCDQASQILEENVGRAREAAAQVRNVNKQLEDFRGWVKEVFGVSMEGDDPVEVVCRSVLQFQYSGEYGPISPEDVEDKIQKGLFSMEKLSRDENALTGMKTTIARIRAAAKSDFVGLDEDVARIVDDNVVKMLADKVHGDVETVKSAVVEHICAKLKAVTDEKTRAECFKDLEFSVRTELTSVQNRLENVVKVVRSSVSDLLHEKVYSRDYYSNTLEDAVVEGVLKDRIAAGKLGAFLSEEEKNATASIKDDCTKWFGARVDAELCQLGKLLGDNAAVVEKLQALLGEKNVSLDSDVLSVLSTKENQLFLLFGQLHLDRMRVEGIQRAMWNKLEGQLKLALQGQVENPPNSKKDWLAGVCVDLESAFFQEYRNALMKTFEEKIRDAENLKGMSYGVEEKLGAFKERFAKRIGQNSSWQALIPGFEKEKRPTQSDAEKWLGKPFLEQVKAWLEDDREKEEADTINSLKGGMEDIKNCKIPRSNEDKGLVSELKKLAGRFDGDSQTKGNEFDWENLFSVMLFNLHDRAKQLGVDDLEPYEEDVRSAIKGTASSRLFIRDLRPEHDVKPVNDFLGLACDKIKARKTERDHQQAQKSQWEKKVVNVVKDWLGNSVNASVAAVLKTAGLELWVENARDAFFAAKNRTEDDLGKDLETMADALKKLMNGISTKVRGYGVALGDELPKNLKQWLSEGLQDYLKDLKAEDLMSAKKLDPLSGRTLAGEVLADLVDIRKKKMLNAIWENWSGTVFATQEVKSLVQAAFANMLDAEAKGILSRLKAQKVGKSSVTDQVTVMQVAFLTLGERCQARFDALLRQKVLFKDKGNDGTILGMFYNIMASDEQKKKDATHSQAEGYLKAYFAKNGIARNAKLGEKQKRDLAVFLKNVFAANATALSEYTLIPRKKSSGSKK